MPSGFGNHVTKLPLYIFESLHFVHHQQLGFSWNAPAANASIACPSPSPSPITLAPVSSAALPSASASASASALPDDVVVNGIQEASNETQHPQHPQQIQHPQHPQQTQQTQQTNNWVRYCLSKQVTSKLLNQSLFGYNDLSAEGDQDSNMTATSNRRNTTNTTRSTMSKPLLAPLTPKLDVVLLDTVGVTADQVWTPSIARASGFGLPEQIH